MACARCGAQASTKGPLTRASFMRHGQCDWNKQHICIGSLDVPMNDTGREQVRNTGTQLRESGVVFDFIVSSPLQRAIESASIVAREIGFDPNEIKVQEWLKEKNAGEVQGLPETDESIAKLFDPTFADTIPGSERISDFEHRLWSGLNTFLDEHKGKRILFVTHGYWMKALCKLIKKLSIKETFEYELPGNAEIMRFAISNPCERCSCTFYM